MTQATATAVVHDLIGVGFGPSNIALAIALQERAQAQGALEVLFLDKQGDYRWHGNTLVSQSELQISFLSTTTLTASVWSMRHLQRSGLYQEQ